MATPTAVGQAVKPDDRLDMIISTLKAERDIIRSPNVHIEISGGGDSLHISIRKSIRYDPPKQ